VDFAADLVRLPRANPTYWFWHGLPTVPRLGAKRRPSATQPQLSA